MILLVISGDAKSMFLLNEYKKRKIVVVHVNYNIHIDASLNEKIISDFCNKYNVPYEVFLVKKTLKGNYQNEAKKIRYNFFQKIYKKYSCSKLIMPHNKNDFLAIALLQQKNNKIPRYFGIKKKNILYNMKIVRPFLHLYWEREILRSMHKKEIHFAADSSKEKLIYPKNKIMLEIQKLKFSEKKEQYQWFRMSNKILKKKFKKVDFWFKKWTKTHFSIVFFSKLSKYKEEIITKYISETFPNINLSKDKIQSLIKFVENKNKNFSISNKHKIFKKNGFLKKQTN